MKQSDVDYWNQINDKAKDHGLLKDKDGNNITFDDVYFDRPVLGKILVLPRSSAELFTYDKPWACISINAPEDSPVKINEENRIDILKQFYNDVEFKRMRYFVSSDASEVWSFVDKIWNEVDLLMVHCYAGISRSTATAKAISSVYQPEYVRYYDQLWNPNPLVYKTLIEKGTLCI